MVKLFVANVAFHRSEDELQKWFEQWGCSVGSVTLLKVKNTGERLGYGFVSVTDADLDRALECNQKFFGERKITVQVAKERSDSRTNERRQRARGAV